ncbi:DsbA family protein [uncultured Sneathiella sp.]|jgi:protein-disulfide isomerase|uniref:DsbA family protein n=1 Tax=uncultured Sneathiella sp. TaxID=879315 RepID=UPI0030DD67D3|tara:strand:+ start:8186 stop:8971 length:786 start_codon:yes stop_codon:yes gene_type:complete
MPKPRKLSTLSIVSLCVLVGLIVFGVFQYAITKPQMTEEAFGERVRGYLLSNPQVLHEVIAELKKQDEIASAKQQKEMMTTLAADLKNDGYSYVAGNPDGDVTIVEFFDYRCGYCKKSFPDLMKTVEEDGNIRLVLKEFPILGPESILASQAAIAAIEQDKYMELHTALMTSRGGLSIDRIRTLATDVGIDVEKLEVDMQADEVRETVEKNYRLAKQLGIDGTPAFVINEEFIPGLISGAEMKQIVAEVREKAKTADDSES